MNDIDAIIAEATAPAAAQAQPEIKDAPEIQPEAAETETVEPQADSQEEAEPEEVFPKKAVNTISRLKKQKERYKAETNQKSAEIQRLAQENAELRAKAQPRPTPQENPPPKEEDFEGRPWADYVEALSDWKAEQKTKTKAPEAKDDTPEWVKEYGPNFDKSAKEAKKTFADYAQVLDDHAEEFDELPLHVHQAAFELANGPHALYMAAKDGVLETLAETKTLAQAAALLGKLEDKALGLKTKPTTKAPAPMAPAKGTASGSKPLESMNAQELLKWVRK